jgi:hypothetical protein
VRPIDDIAQSRRLLWGAVALLGVLVTLFASLSSGLLDEVPIPDDKLITVEGRLDNMQLYRSWFFGWVAEGCEGRRRCTEECRFDLKSANGVETKFRTRDSYILNQCRNSTAGSHAVVRHSGPGNFFRMGQDIYSMKAGELELHTYRQHLDEIATSNRARFALGLAGLTGVLCLGVWGFFSSI